MKSTRFLCYALIIKNTSKTMEAIDCSWLLELIIKNSYLNNYSKSIFCQANCFNFFSSQNSYFVKQILIFSLIMTSFLSSLLNMVKLQHVRR